VEGQLLKALSRLWPLIDLSHEIEDGMNHISRPPRTEDPRLLEPRGLQHPLRTRHDLPAGE